MGKRNRELDRQIQTRYWHALVAVVLERDEYTCWVCSGRANTADHLLPRSFGGSNHLNNLAAICHECNNKRGNRANSEARQTIDWGK